MLKQRKRAQEGVFLPSSTEQEMITLGADLPEGVSASLQGRSLEVRGPLGACRRDLSKIRVEVMLKGKRVEVRTFGKRIRDRAVAGTTLSHVKNMITGVTKGFTYRLKVVYAHFPITVRVRQGEVHVENFYGERRARVAKIVGECGVKVEGDDVVVTGPSKEDVGATAANIERATKVKRKDHRVFLDGVYLYERGSRRV